ncbi:GLIPR1-like protein 1 [Podarcis raffonei]|uniref:GLIPR1-like protein 1 n=1 Tax=Podarcis raffonei TaxID=65483 RepID=UPI00232971CE|nr:GLIPR1-like protein 1 [Podarcis raffonei]
MGLLWWPRVALALVALEAASGRSFPSIRNRTFINQYLDTHNNYRRGVNPPASNMLYMTFDLALARIARAWAQKCIVMHNPTDMVHPDPKFRPFGENIWAVTGYKYPFDPAGPIEDFYDEVKYYTYNTHKCTRVCGHYTQVVWANTYKIGCAIVHCPASTNSKGAKTKNFSYFVCTYGPPGNYAGVRPYKAGAPCSQCPKGDTCQKKLCRNPEREKENSIRYSRWYPPFESRIICDESCIAVAILRPLLMFLAFAAVYYLKLCYPGLGYKA